LLSLIAICGAKNKLEYGFMLLCICYTEWWVAGVVICLEQGADLQVTQLMPLPLTVSCFSNILIGFTFLVPAHPEKGPLNGCVCIYICYTFSRKKTNYFDFLLRLNRQRKWSIIRSLVVDGLGTSAS